MKVDLASIVLGWNKPLATAEHLLARAADHAAINGIAEGDMLDWRLAPDMFPLSRQFQIVCNVAQQWAARAAGVEIPPEPQGGNVAEIRAMIGRTREFMSSLTADAFAGRDDESVTVNLGEIEPTMSVGQWVMGFANTNIFFHLSIAYAILRSRGVPLGKPDLFGGGL